MTSIDRAKAKVMDAADNLEQLIAEYDRVCNLPEEPVDADGNGVVWFEKKFRTTLGNLPAGTYTYAAVRSRDDGRWYITGQVTRGYNWAGLLDFMAQGQSVMPEIWLTTEQSRIL